MSWALVFRAREYLKASLWFYPIVGAIVGSLLALITRWADASVTVPQGWQYAPSTASTVLSTIVGAAVGLTGFVVTVTVLAIQMATGTFSARYMRVWYRDRMLKAVLTVLAATVTLAFSLLRQVGSQQAPDIGVSVAGALLLVSLVLFLLFFDRFIHRLRPVAVAALVGKVAGRIITTVTRVAEADTTHGQAGFGAPRMTVLGRRDGSVQAISVRGLIRWASRYDQLLVMRVAIGDFVTVGQPVIAVFGDASLPARAPRHLERRVALGVERTFEQDPAFAVRIMVDVAIKALSAAINDPTTAVQTLDHLGRVLRLLGSTPLHGSLMFRDGQGQPRLLLPGRTWDDYLALGVTEIREYGGTSIQVTRRLRAMLEDLHESVLPEHRPAVVAELAKLDATVAAGFAGTIDEDSARARDRQGIGGPAEATVATHTAANR